MKRLGRTIGLASELGMSMGLTAAGCVVLGLLAGRWLDARLGTAPVASLASLVLGAVLGQVAVYRLAMRAARRLSAPGDADASIGHMSSGLAKAGRVLALMLLPAIAGLGMGMLIDALFQSGALITLLLAIGGSTLGLVLGVQHVRHTHRSSMER